MSKLATRTLAALALLLGPSLAAHATSYQYHGLIDLDYGSSIAGAPKHTRYFVDFVLNGDILDTDNTVFENDFYNANNVRGLTTIGSFSNPITSLRLTLDPTSVGTLDLSGLNFDPNSSWARAVDANQPPDPQAAPCDEYKCISEHITLHARDLTPGSPVASVWFNLYNSNFYEPIYAFRQLLLDTSASGNPFAFADLFLHGPQTLTEFQSYRPPNIVELRDPVLLTGPNGTSAAGRFLSLAYVPPGVPGPLPILGVGAGLAWSRRLRRRIGGSSRGGRLAASRL
ncbi:MAG: hypothetical protein ACK5N0_06560 [Synechococcaceae cyanobacterium]